MPWALAAAGVAAAGGLASSSMAASAQGKASQQQADIANRNLASQQALARNNGYLSTEALRRSTAGSKDSQGNAITYDPGSNTWITTLGDGSRNVQNASDAASVIRNTRDLAASGRANSENEKAGLSAASDLSTAQAQLRNYNPLTPQVQEAKLQQSATAANRAATAPIIADTLRAFARTGTAAGPVLDQLRRGNADTLRKTLTDDTVQAQGTAADSNAKAIGALSQRYNTLRAGATQTPNFAPISTQDPSSTLAALAQKYQAAGAGGANSGIYGNSASGQNLNNAAKNAGDNVFQDPTAGAISSLSSQLGSGLKNPDIVNAIKSMFSGGGNAGDALRLQQQMGIATAPYM